MSNSMPHFIVSCKPGWSHLRSLCVLSSKIAAARPIVVTILVTNVDGITDKITAEVTRCLKVEGPPKGEVRVVAVGPDLTNDSQVAEIDSFQVAWKALINESPVKCASTGIVYWGTARPSLVILDGFQISWLIAIRSMDSPPPILQWMMAFSGGFLRTTGPETMGGRGDFLRAFTDEQQKNPDNLEQQIQGNVIHVVGMPPMYDWEFFPQELGLKKRRILIVEAIMSRFIQEADGLLTACAIDYDGEEALTNISAWISQINNRPTFHLGPMLPFKPGTSVLPHDAEIAALSTEIGTQVSNFLDQAYDRYGKCSVVYISLGTEHWPESLDHLGALLFALERRGFPFLLAHGYRTAKIPENLRTHFENSDTALFTPWAPQQTILAHKACGWFVTHGGANGTMEALSQGVPMIGWPFAVDQPMNIARLVYELDVAFELIQVRTGDLGLKPILATGETPLGTVEAFEIELEEILAAMKGREGARKRANASRIQEKLSEAWGTGGKARQAFEKFLDRYC